jgi:hypothetical protein
MFGTNVKKWTAAIRYWYDYRAIHVDIIRVILGLTH